MNAPSVASCGTWYGEEIPELQYLLKLGFIAGRGLESI